MFLDAERELDVDVGVCDLRNGKKASVSIGGGPETSHPIFHLEGACLGLRTTEREREQPAVPSLITGPQTGTTDYNLKKILEDFKKLFNHEARTQRTATYSLFNNFPSRQWIAFPV